MNSPGFEDTAYFIAMTFCIVGFCFCVIAIVIIVDCQATRLQQWRKQSNIINISKGRK